MVSDRENAKKEDTRGDRRRRCHVGRCRRVKEKAEGSEAEGRKLELACIGFPLRSSTQHYLIVRIHAEDFGRPNVFTRDHCVKTFEVRRIVVGVRFEEAEFFIRCDVIWAINPGQRTVLSFYLLFLPARKREAKQAGYALWLRYSHE